jgi:hypothetical protein
MASNYHESVYTRSINELIRNVENPSSQDVNLVRDAKHYFESYAVKQQQIQTLEQKKEDIQESLAAASSSQQSKLKNALQQTNTEISQFHQEQTQARLARLSRAIQVCEMVLELSEGADEQDTLVKSARFLGTCLLLSSGTGKRLPELHQRLKPVYKTVLSLRLLDALMLQGKVKQKYLINHYDDQMRFKAEDSAEIKRTLLYPIMFAALFQDIGMQHPDAQMILRGPDGDLDPFRVLDVPERKQMLKITFQQTIDYLKNGLGIAEYRGNSRDERDLIEQQNSAALSFCLSILRDTIKPLNGLGEIIKVPQIYASVVLSTKRNYCISDLPKACTLIERMAEKGSINQLVLKQFVALVGHFPQGFGIAYIPNCEHSSNLDRYEYAIVNKLKPDHLYEPMCRTVTRNLTFVSSGQNSIVQRSQNMYFESVRQQMAKVGDSKLKQILEKLQHNFEAQSSEAIIPDCWQPHEFFQKKEHQNLWNKAVSVISEQED